MAITVRLGSITFGGGTDGDGDRFTVRDLPGWTGAPVELVTVEKPLSAGAVLVRGRYRSRGVTIVGHGIAPTRDGVWRVRSKLEAAVSPTADTTLYVDEPTGTKTLVVRLADNLMVRPAGPRAIEFEIPLLAVNPTKA